MNRPRLPARLPVRLPVRLPLGLFAVLALATVGAFYITQHLKVQNPLINGGPRTDPGSINPRDSGVCPDLTGRRTSFKVTRIGFYLQSHSDHVFVYVIDADGQDVATMGGSGQYMTVARDPTHPVESYFTWNGHLADGRVAPAGTYTFRAYLQHEGRSLPINGVQLHVLSRRPVPRVVSLAVSGSTTPAGATPTLAPRRQRARIRFTVSGHPLAVRVLVYRSHANPTRPLRLVASFAVDPRRRTATWNGLINGRPAPAGSYLLGVAVTDRSCTTGTTPLSSDPAPHRTAGQGVNVSPLSATGPSDPVSAGLDAGVSVAAAGAPYTWTLRRAGEAGVLSHGSAAAARLSVRLPGVGLYDLELSAGGYHASVPLVASAVGARADARVLVILPALSWQGSNPTDDDSDGLVDTLGGANADQITLARPYAGGLPPGLADEADLLRFLDSAGLRYDLTTDVALAEGSGPSLSGRHGVLLDGTFTWLPAQLATRLRAFVSAGGGLFADGIHSLQASAPITDGTYGPIAGPARRLSVDPFGIRHGAVSPSYGELITSLHADTLGIFDQVDALQYRRYQVLTPTAGRISSVAGVADAAPTVVGAPLGRGTVVEAGLAGFGVALGTDPESGQLLTNVFSDVLK